jgi:prepilin-type N-terminal cleavage/methylation domain-containing protein
MIGTDKKRISTKSQRGFSLVELMAATAILTIVIGVLTDGMMQVQQKSASDVNKVGMAQEARQFMDQILRDLRQCGFPSLAMFDSSISPTPTVNSSYVAGGLISFSSSAIQFEGDIDGSGVSEVYLQVVVPAGGSCPCTLQRGTVTKASYLLGGTPAYYTELDNLMSQNVFTAYKYDGTAYNSATDQLSDIKNIGVTLYIRSPLPDVNVSSVTYSTTTMVSEARINN